MNRSVISLCFVKEATRRHVAPDEACNTAVTAPVASDDISKALARPRK
jgi:hypothetical protein